MSSPISTRSSRKRPRPNLLSPLSDNSNTIHNEPPQNQKAKLVDGDTIKKVNPKDENNSGGTA